MPQVRKEFIAVVAGVAIVAGGALGGVSLQKEITQLQNKPVEVVTNTVVVTPTVIPTATPSALLKPRIYTPASITKGVK